MLLSRLTLFLLVRSFYFILFFTTTIASAQFVGNCGEGSCPGHGGGGGGGTGGGGGVTGPMTSATVMNARSASTPLVVSSHVGHSKNMEQSQSYSYAVSLFPLAGRVSNLDLTLYYNSQLWIYNGSNNSMVLAADFNTPGPGFTLHKGLVQFAPDLSFGVYYDSTGFRHLFFPTSTANLFETQDSTYIQIQYPSSSGGSVTVIYPNGVKLTCQPFTVLANNTTEYRTTQIEDTNGNFMSITYINNNDLRINTITDTVGRFIKFSYNGNGLLTSVAQLHADGTIFRKYSFTITPLTVNFNFTLKATTGLGLTPGFLTSGTSQVNVLTKVTKPDGTSVAFDYVNDGTTNGNPDWAIVKTIQELSSSGNVRYSMSYVLPTASAATRSSNPGYTQQTVNDGQNTGTWTYSSTTNSSGMVTTYITTDPCGTTQTTTYSANGDSLDGLPIKRVISYNPPTPLPAGCSNSAQNNLRTVNTAWALDGNGTNPHTTSVTTILDDGTTQSQVKCSTYDAFGHCTDALQYDFGNNQPGSLLQEILVTYAALGSNIADRVSDIQVKDGGGTVKTHRVFNYDEGTVTDFSTNPANHDAAFTSSVKVRGNLTSVIEHPDPLNTATGITTTYTYDAAGNMLTAQRGSGPQTQWVFSSATQYAYSDSVSVGPQTNQLTTTFVYDTDRGSISSVTDANGQKTTFAQDLDSRSISTTTPDAVTVTTSYDDGATNPSVTVSNTANSLISTMVVDGRGRTLSQQVLNGTSAVSATAFSYNILGQLLQSSNPYAPKETVQNTVFGYDGLGRRISATPPSIGSAAQNPYQTAYAVTSFKDAGGNIHYGPAVTLTDPAGKQRKQYSDALGRLLRVDEPGTSGGSAGAGSATISGTEQSVSVANGGGATAATGSVSLSGSDRSTQVLTHNATVASGTIGIYGSENSTTIDPCADQTPPDGGPPPSCPRTVYDYGSVSLTINGVTKSVNYSANSDVNSIASALAGAFGNNGTYAVSASGSTITVTADSVGAWGNGITLSASSATGDSFDFGGPSFGAQTSGATLIGGSDNGYTTMYDTGTVTVSVTINNTNYSKQSTYGQSSTPSSIASDLANKINSDTTLNKLLIASSSSSVLNLTSVATGANTAYPLSASAATNSQYFSSGSSSFAASPSGSTLTPGTNGTVYDAGTITLFVTGFSANPITYTANYSQGSTPATIASALSGSINADSFAPVSATVTSGSNVVNLTAKNPGSDTNYGVTVTSMTSQGTYFSQPSFAGTGTALSGGTDPTVGLTTPLSTFYSYDAVGNLIQIIQGQQTRTYVYDGIGRMTSASLPETANQAITYTYTDFGAVSQRTDPRTVPGTSKPITTIYSYDSLNRLTSVSYNDGTPGVSYTYNAPKATNNTGGRLANVTVGVSTQPAQYVSDSYQYDVMGRVTKCTKVIGTNTYITSYSYNSDGTLASVTYPSGRVVNNSYDGIGRLTQVGTGGNTLLTLSSFNAAGQALNLTYGNQMKGTYSFNNQLQLASVLYGNISSTLLSLSYNYGGAQNNGLIQGITDNLTPARSTTYTYDELNRLKLAQTNDLTSANTWKLKFTYDRYGNRLSQIPIAGTATMPTSEELVDPTTNRISGNGYMYDNAGNVVSDGLNNYAFDAENQLKSTAPIPGLSGSSASFAYDAMGLRVNNNRTIYIYSGGAPIAEYANGAAAGSPSMEYVYAGGSPLASVSSSGVTYYYGDQLSTRVQTDANGNPTRTYGHYPFGETWYETGTPNKWKFTNYERDASSGLDYAQARFYTSRQGRFISMDPLAGSASYPQSLNRFAYVMNNPISFSDPTGARCQDSAIGCVPNGGGPNYTCLLNDNGDCAGGGGGGNCMVDGFSVDCGLAGGLSGMGATVDCLVNLCGLTAVSGPDGNYVGFVTPSYGIDDSISYSFSFTTYRSGVQLTDAALAEMLGLPTTAGAGPSGSQAAPNSHSAWPIAPAPPCNHAGHAPDPSVFAAKGKAGSTNEILDDYYVYQFHKGGNMDAQVQGAKPDYANYVYGVYMSAAGWTLDQALSGADFVAQHWAQYPPSVPKDPKYQFTPEINVMNITYGFNAQQMGSLCTTHPERP